MPDSLREALRRGGLVLDGAMGTELAARGLDLRASGDSTALWNRSNPEAVRAVHRAYVAAGADAVLTNTFVASRDALAAVGAEGEVEEIHRAAVAHARAAAPRWVLGDLGPIWAWRHRGPVEPKTARAAYRAQARLLVEAGVDGLVVETLGEPAELAAAVAGCRDAGAPVVIATMSFVARAGRWETIAGASLDEAARAMVDSGADAAGANCALGPPAMERLALALGPRCPVPRVFKPNAGTGVEGGEPASFGRTGARLVRAGAAAVGGCCGAGPAHVAALRALVDHTGRGAGPRGRRADET